MRLLLSIQLKSISYSIQKPRGPVAIFQIWQSKSEQIHCLIKKIRFLPFKLRAQKNYPLRRKNKMEATKEKTQLVNGVNTEQLFSTIDLIKENPDIAKFKFRATNKWINGTHCRGTIKDFYGALKEDNSRPSVDYDMDEPPVLLGNNDGRNPVEYLLVALSGCLTTSLIAHASAKGIKINGVESRYEG